MISKIFSFFENTSISFRTWLFSFLALIFFRVMTENLIGKPEDQTVALATGLFLHNLLFFLLLYLFLWLFLSKLLKIEKRKIANVLLWGYWLMLFPPILDRIIFGDRDVWSFYFFGGPKELVGGFFTFFGEHLTVGVTLGSRLIIGLVLALITIYVFYKIRNWLKILGIFLVLYFIFFFFGSLPSFFGIIISLFQGEHFGQINALDIAAIFLVPVDFFSLNQDAVKTALVYRINLIYSVILFVFLVFWQWRLNRNKFLALLKNIRYPQTIFNVGLLFLGLGLGWYYYPKNFSADFFSFLIVLNLMFVVFCSWFFSVFINDLSDVAIDKKSNNDRPLIKKVFEEKEYENLAIIFLLLSLVISLAINIKIFILVLLYHFLTTVYSLPPFRLKRFVLVASALSALASLLFMLIGFMVFSTDQTLTKFPFPVAVLLFLTFALIIPLKDLKDAQSDRENKVFTLPALVGVKPARSILAGLIFLSYFFSVYILNETRIFLPALIFGSASFWVVSSEKFSVRKLNWWVLGLVTLYGLSILRIVFL